MNFIEYLTFLKEKYGTTNSEILEELKNNDMEITKSSLSHKLSGERGISSKELEIIIEIIRPTIAETNRLLELYKILQFGEGRFKEVLYIKDYIEDLCDDSVINFRCDIDNIDSISSINDEKMILDVLYFMFEKSWNKDTIKIFCQPDFKRFINELIFFNQKGSANIEYLVCMNNDYKSDNNLYNINLLRFLGKIVKDNFNVNVRYFYDKINSRINEFTLFPFFIICGKYILLINHDFKSGFLSSNSDFIEMVTAKFDRMFSESKNLFKVVSNVADYMHICTQLELACKEKFYTLQYHPCVLYIGEKRLTFDHVKDSFFLKSELINEVKMREKNKKVTGYNLHSKEGTKDFLDTGLTSDMSPSYAIPYSVEERSEVLKKIKNIENHVDVELETSFIALPKEMFLGCYDNGTVLISYRSKLNECARLILNEKGLYRSVNNFFEYLMQ